MYRLGIDLGGTNVAVGVVDAGSRIVSRAAAETPKTDTKNTIPNAIAACAERALREAGLSRADCAGAGLGTPGSCDTASGLVRYAHNLDWDCFDAAAALQERLHLPVRIANDGDCAALGEVIAGAAKGCACALVLTLGTGIGGGYILDGKICAGNRSLGGEFGHTRIAMDGEKCSCGETGCWEAYASASALVRQAERAAVNAPDSELRRCERLDGKAIYAAAATGDAAALAVTAQYAEYVGMGLVNLLNVLFPERILLGGGISGAGEALFAPVRAYVRAHSYVRDETLLPPILPAALGRDAGIIGAAALISD